MKFITLLITSSLLIACGTTDLPNALPKQQDDSSSANALFETFFNEDLARSPVKQTYLGIKTDYGKWDDISEGFEEQSHTLKRGQLARLNKLSPESMDASTALSFQLQRQQLENAIEDHQWRHHSYPVNQMYGIHTLVPSLLINQHRIDDKKDAYAYISRLQGITALFDQTIAALKIRADKGIIVPKFVFPRIIEASRNIITGAPFIHGDDSVLYADFKRKIDALNLPDSERSLFITHAETALKEQVKPAYKKLIKYLTDLEKQADIRDGAWKFPQGKAFYNNALNRTTTTSLTADEIHNLGLQEVSRIHDEMRAIMQAVNFKGDLHAFFAFMRTDKQFYYTEDEASKEAYLSKATAIIDQMKSRLDELFITQPKAQLTVQRVEAFREKSAGKAFYQQPSMDGTRPGLYYANLYKMSNMPTYQMEALAYHEGIPGHHMQIAIAQELQDIPMFRKFGRYTAYTEGWGLYSEWIPKEMGLYQDPYSDFGRLAMEIWRACRLVVDTGIHAKKWTRQQAIDYLKTNTPNPEGDIVNAIERYIVLPSQATAYKIGMLKIQQLRQKSQQALGDKFDIRQFHDVILRNGPVPLNRLEDLVDQWVKETQKS